MSFLDRHFLEFSSLGDCCILLHQMGQFHGWFWRVGKTKKIRAKLRVRKIHPEFIQNSLQNSFRNSPKIHPRIHHEIQQETLEIHLKFTAPISRRKIRAEVGTASWRRRLAAAASTQHRLQNDVVSGFGAQPFVRIFCPLWPKPTGTSGE